MAGDARPVPSPRLPSPAGRPEPEHRRRPAGLRGARPLRDRQALPLPIALGAFGLGLPVAVLLLVFVATGTGIALFDIWWHTALAERVPPHMLSRVTAYDWMGSLALLPIGYVLAGPLGEAFGAVEVLTVGSAIALGALAGALLVGDVRDLPRLEPTATGASR